MDDRTRCHTQKNQSSSPSRALLLQSRAFDNSPSPLHDHHIGSPSQPVHNSSEQAFALRKHHKGLRDKDEGIHDLVNKASARRKSDHSSSQHRSPFPSSAWLLRACRKSTFESVPCEYKAGTVQHGMLAGRDVDIFAPSHTCYHTSGAATQAAAEDRSPSHTSTSTSLGVQLSEDCILDTSTGAAVPFLHPALVVELLPNPHWQTIS